MIIFILGTMLGILGGDAVCVRYLRHEIAADIGPQLRRMQGKLDNLERALNLVLMTQCRLAESKIGRQAPGRTGR